MDNTKAKSKNKMPVIIGLIVVIAVTLVAGSVVVYNCFFQKQPATPSKGVVGVISDGWDTGLKDQTSPHASGIRIPGYGIAVMNAGDKSLHLSIGNPKENNCGFYATLKLDDGTVLYKSELLKPGYGLTDVPLSQTLEAGEYTAVVSYQCVTLDEEQTPLNSAESGFKLIVK